MYLSGEGVDKDESKAMTYFKRGAQKGTIRYYFLKMVDKPRICSGLGLPK